MSISKAHNLRLHSRAPMTVSGPGGFNPNNQPLSVVQFCLEKGLEKSSRLRGVLTALNHLKELLWMEFDALKMPLLAKKRMQSITYPTNRGYVCAGFNVDKLEFLHVALAVAMLINVATATICRHKINNSNTVIAKVEIA